MPAHQVKTGTVTSVFTVTVVKPGIQLLTLASAPLVQSGTDTHALIHAVEEEFLIPPAVNVFAPPEIGMEVHALSAQILKSGQLPG